MVQKSLVVFICIPILHIFYIFLLIGKDCSIFPWGKSKLNGFKRIDTNVAIAYFLQIWSRLKNQTTRTFPSGWEIFESYISLEITSMSTAITIEIQLESCKKSPVEPTVLKIHTHLLIHEIFWGNAKCNKMENKQIKICYDWYSKIYKVSPFAKLPIW